MCAGIAMRWLAGEGCLRDGGELPGGLRAGVGGVRPALVLALASKKAEILRENRLSRSEAYSPMG